MFHIRSMSSIFPQRILSPGGTSISGGITKALIKHGTYVKAGISSPRLASEGPLSQGSSLDLHLETSSVLKDGSIYKIINSQSKTAITIKDDDEGNLDCCL